jgi:hypothetical protein
LETAWVVADRIKSDAKNQSKSPGTPDPRRKLAPEEYKSIADKLRAAWPK